jgi:hypothetical protein
MMTADFRLTNRANSWISAVRGSFAACNPIVEPAVASAIIAMPGKGYEYRQVLS